MHLNVLTQYEYLAYYQAIQNPNTFMILRIVASVVIFFLTQRLSKIAHNNNNMSKKEKKHFDHIDLRGRPPVRRTDDCSQSPYV